MKSAIKTLLQIDLEYSAKSIGFNVDSSVDISEGSLYEIINQIEIAILNEIDPSIISSVCGLLWTHYSEKFNLLSEYIYSLMARVGFSPIHSMLSLSQNENQVNYSSVVGMLETAVQRQRYSVATLGKRFFLTEFQSRLWKALELKDHIAVSAPTSAGKSFLICLNLVSGVATRGGISIYVVPNLTLMSQVANDLIALIKHHQLDIDVRTGLIQNGNRSTIFVLTQERLIEPGAEMPPNGINYLIIDEVQNIERAFDFESKDERSKLLLDVLINLHDNFTPQKTVIIGPRISEVGALGGRLFNKKTTPITAHSSPVTNLSYGITPASKSGTTIILTQYSELLETPLTLTLPNSIGAIGFEKPTYNDDFNQYLLRVIEKNSGSLIFSPTSTQARRSAVRISAEQEYSQDNTLSALSEYIESTVSGTYDLAQCVRKGVAFHHGKMPQHIRNAIEVAISDGKFNYITCTTTLMQGVNIPAKTIFIRNPNLYLKNGPQATSLSGYEVANLRGRAGRLMRDFVGRTFVLDGTSFEEEHQASLFDSPSKHLEGTYENIFENHRELIVNSITDLDGTRGSLAKYIANVIYTDPSAASTLSRKGISLSDSEFLIIKKAVRKLSVPTDVCKEHRFWDPFDLDKIFQRRFEFSPPKSHFDSDCQPLLQDTIEKLIKIVPERAEHFLGKANLKNPMPGVISTNAAKWANETPLNKLLDTNFARMSNDNTERSISLLQNTISYGLPSLLSPVYATLGIQTLLLASLQRGASRPETLMQLDHNIPRETAILVTNRARKNGRKLSDISDVLQLLKDQKARYWNAIQFRHLIDIELILSKAP